MCVYDSDTTGVYEFAIYPETDFGWKSCICYNCEYEHLIWYEATSLVTQLFVEPSVEKLYIVLKVTVSCAGGSDFMLQKCDNIA